MSNRLSRPLVAALSFALVVGLGASSFANDGREFTPKERRKFEKLVEKGRRRAVADIKREARDLSKRIRKLRKRTNSVSSLVDDPRELLQEICLEIEDFHSKRRQVESSIGPINMNADDATADDIMFSAAGTVLGEEGITPAVAAALARLGRDASVPIEAELRLLRQMKFLELEAEKGQVDVPPKDEPDPAKFQFRRTIESHQAQPLDGSDPLIFFRPGLQTVQVTEEGDATIEMVVAFDEPTSFVNIQLKRPDGTVLTDFVAQQQDSENGTSRVLKFNFPLDTLPAPGDAVLFTASSAFTDSLFSLTDPFDCLAFIFPGLAIPTTPSASKAEDAAE